MGVSMILGSKDFEAVADGDQYWVVSAQYNFDSEKYGSFVVVNEKDTKLSGIKADKMYVMNSATALTEATLKNASAAVAPTGKPNETHLYAFGTSDDVIGRINTSGQKNYVVIVSEQDLAGASVALSATT